VDRILPYESGTAWIDDLTDDQCLEIFWLYVENSEEFFAKHPKPLLGQALRYALRQVITAEQAGTRQA
jgi:hypothetical protein